MIKEIDIRAAIVAAAIGLGLVSSGTSAAPWNGSESPFWFNHYQTRNWQQLPTNGHVTQPVWTSSYFPLFEDSINHRWHSDGINGITSPNEFSPAEKYDQAFNGWSPSANFSTLRPFSRNSWNSWDQNYYSQLGPLASWVSENRGNGDDRSIALERQNNGSFSGWSMQTWWGHCHAWAPAAMLEKQACGSVTRNGVTFFPGDLEALMIFAYDRAWEEGAWIGQACREAPGQVQRDQFGRPTATECADPNPGSFHMVVTNFIGAKDRPLIYERIRSEEIWNQPLVGYNIVNQTPVSANQANARLGLSGNSWSFNPAAAGLIDVTMDITWLTEAFPATTPTPMGPYERTDRLTYILEVDANGAIVGGEYYGNSLGNVGPDYIWQPEQLANSHLPGLLDLQTVRGLIDESCGLPVGSTPLPAGCPQTLSASGNTSCSVSGQECNNTWFTDIEGFDTALCQNNVWVSKDAPAGSGGSGGGTPPTASEQCPNGIFGNGFMYLNSSYVANTCSSTGQLCAGNYFYDLGRFDTAECNGANWVLAGTAGSGGGNTGGGVSNGGGDGSPAGVCGNNIVEVGEACDDGNTSNGDSCTSSCQVPGNGNGNGNGGGNTGGGQPDSCPNGIFDNGQMYAGSTLVSNSCSNTGQVCTSQYFYGSSAFIDAVCNGNQWIRSTGAPPSAPVCGNNSVESGEQCDDGNTSNGDGCSSSCTTESTTPVSSACPNSVFEDGRMYDSNSVLTTNQCGNEGATCPSVYFYSVGGYTGGRCSNGRWVTN